MSSRRVFLSSMAGVAGALAFGPRAADAKKPSEAPAKPLPALPATSNLRFEDRVVGGDRALGRRYLLAIPTKALASGEKLPLLVLLHGLGESGDEVAGVTAWALKYGLVSCYDRLLAPPVVKTSKRADLEPARAEAITAELAARPFKGFAIACPFTPRVAKMANPTASYDAYAKWLVETVIPDAQARASLATDAAKVHVGGCSMGGPAALEVLLRYPAKFGGWSGVQSAMGEAKADDYAKRLAKALAGSSKKLFVETSAGDAFKKGNDRFAAKLAAAKIARDVRSPPGPHDQPWLREVGTLELLHWHDRAF